MNLNVLVLPGDGIGTEVTGEAVRVMRVVAQKWGHQLTIREGLLGAERLPGDEVIGVGELESSPSRR